MKAKNKLFIYVIIGILVLVVAWWLGSPLIIDKRVNEQSLADNSTDFDVKLQGSFVDADSFHKTSGEAQLIEVDGKKYLSFENFQTTNGPDLYVYLAKDNEAEEFINLGRLKGNIGNQNYEIPENTDINSYDNALIWCRAFSVLFGSAKLQPPAN